MKIGDNIKKLRKANDMTQKDLAKALNMSSALIAQWEVHKREPQNKELIKMSKLFNVSIDEILGTIPLFSNAETYSTDSNQVLRPILGVVKAGYNMYCDENIEGYKPVDKKRRLVLSAFGCVFRVRV